NLTENAITISGEKKKEEKVEKKDYYHFERSYGSFSRTFTLPAEVQTDKAKASFKKGVLEVRIPKTEEAKKKVKKVAIESE
ncbi:MAG: Hsp20/alpha crystallin family protein, partial [Nitrospirae bacterium]|nr:Hsp20/alpha crystallin family protein [Nitrospirota bacterium]